MYLKQFKFTENKIYFRKRTAESVFVYYNKTYFSYFWNLFFFIVNC